VGNTTNLEQQMTVATTTESTGKSNQATFLKVGQNLYRNESSETYYGLTKRAGKQFRTALRMADGTPIKDRALAERALRKWLVDLEKGQSLAWAPTNRRASESKKSPISAD
jgi:hypothetical protein